jgi:beta-lactamase regulating signal transducer with metallopeptidase domain
MALLVILILPLAPALIPDSPAVDTIRTSTVSEGFSPTVSIAPLPAHAVWWGIGLWLLWAAPLGWRTGVSAIRLRRGKRESITFPALREVRLEHWMSVRARGRRTRLVLSNAVPDAAVFGMWSPVIAVAPSLLVDLDDGDLDRIVMHEWAHVQRRDDLTNLVQTLIRISAGWHPAVWWVDRRLTLEREASCDERAVQLTGSARAYASCLVRLAAIRSGACSEPLAPGALSSSALGVRIVRLVGRTRRRSAASAVTTAAAAMAILAALAIALSNMPLVVTRASNLGEVLVPDSTPAPVADEGQRGAPLVRASAASARTTGAVDRTNGKPVVPASLIDGPAITTIQSAPPPGITVAAVDVSAAREASLPKSAPVAHVPLVALSALPGGVLSPPAAGSLPPRDGGGGTPWKAAADAGMVVGRGSQNAAAATAGFFTRFGKRIAGRF